ncbi:MAG TPA: EamA family transporter, partial [Chthoniobacterales bacterium]
MTNSQCPAAVLPRPHVERVQVGKRRPRPISGDGSAIPRSKQSGAPLLHLILAFAAIYLIWGSTFLGIRVAIESIPPMLMGGVRWSIAGALLYAILRWRGAPRPTLRDWGTAAIIGGGIIFAGNGSVTYTEQYIPSGTVAVIVAVVPAMMAVMGWLSGTLTRPRLPVWIGIAL